MLGKTLAAGTLCALVLAASASAGASIRTGHVVLMVTVSGGGIVKVNGKQVKIFGKHEVNCPVAPGSIDTICKRAFHVRKGNRVTLVATPQKGGKVGPWTGACKGTEPKCTLIMKQSKQVSETFIPHGARSNPYPLATPGTVFDGLGDWSIRILGASQQGNHLVVDVKGTLSPSTVNSWTLGLAYQAYVTEGPKDEVPIGGPGLGCSAADNSFLSVGANVAHGGRATSRAERLLRATSASQLSCHLRNWSLLRPPDFRLRRTRDRANRPIRLRPEVSGSH